ncbi:hypothetical protein AK812_SmicGene16337 [Symbiodinium microadriaticum]|uniref:Uncharacterized protein n=1 Tax=Symbiodinium microadriaticum TaxID=2951 RepID=A0A1Q9E0P3_SYMMI|nr:hypothetical protein AK812_SmicGene16337 [Symbiodinium microadriaticum]
MHEKPGQPEGPGCLLWLWSHAKLAALLAAALSGLAHSVSGRKLLNLVNTGYPNTAMLRKSWLLAIGGLVGVTGSYIAPRYQILDAKADIRDLDVGDLDDMEVDVPKPFVEHVKEVREQRNKPKIDFNSEDFKRDPASFMTSGSSGVSMAFVQLDVKWAMEHGKHETTSLARSWTSLLENGGVSAQIYDTDPGSILIVNKIPAQNIKIKEFVLSQPHVDYYELNQKRFYPDGRMSPLVTDDERRERMARSPDGAHAVNRAQKSAAQTRFKEKMEENTALKARVAELEARLRELEELQSSSELLELRALVEAQEAALEDQRRIIESQSALIEDLSSHLKATSSNEASLGSAANASAAVSASKEPAPSPTSPEPQGPAGPSGPSKRRSGSGYGRGTMSAPGLRKPVSASSGGAGAPGGREKADNRGKENQKRFGCSSGSISSASSGGLVRGPSPRTTPRSASTGVSRRLSSLAVEAALVVEDFAPEHDAAQTQRRGRGYASRDMMQASKGPWQGRAKPSRREAESGAEMPISAEGPSSQASHLFALQMADKGELLRHHPVPALVLSYFGCSRCTDEIGETAGRWPACPQIQTAQGNDFDGTAAAARAAPGPSAQGHDQGYEEYDSNWSWQGWQGWQGWQDWQGWTEWEDPSWNEVATRPWAFGSERHCGGYEPQRPPEPFCRDYAAFDFDEAQPEFTLADIANRTKLFAEASKTSVMQDARSWPASTSMPGPRPSYENAADSGFAWCQTTWEVHPSAHSDSFRPTSATLTSIPVPESLQNAGLSGRELHSRRELLEMRPRPSEAVNDDGVASTGQAQIACLQHDQNKAGSQVPATPAGATPRVEESLPSSSQHDSRGFSKWFGPNAASPPESAFATSVGFHEAGFSTDAGSGVESSEEEVQK